MPKSAARDLSVYRSAHTRDVIIPNKIRAALAAIAKEYGPEGWEYENELIKRAGLSQSDIGEYREQFLKHIVNTPAVHGKSSRRVWFASEKAAREARGGDAE